MVDTITFAQGADIYLSKLQERRRKPVKASSVACFRSVLKLARTVPGLDATALADIDSEHLRLIVEHLAAKSPNTINLALRTVKAVVASAVDDRGNQLFVKHWNTAHVDPPPLENAKAKIVLKAEQIEAAIASASPGMKAFIAVQAASGLRKGEMLALDMNDFDAAAGTLRVDATDGYFGKTAPKTKSGNRIVDIHPSIVDSLVSATAGRSNGRLFPLTPDAVRRAFERLGIHSHDLRHFRYTHLMRADCPNVIRDYWIGHASKGMELVYGHLAQDADLRRKLAKEVGIGFKLDVL
jgi:integrase